MSLNLNKIFQPAILLIFLPTLGFAEVAQAQPTDSQGNTPFPNSESHNGEGLNVDVTNPQGLSAPFSQTDKPETVSPWLAQPVKTGPNLQVQIGLQGVDTEPGAATISTMDSYTSARAAVGYNFKHDYTVELGYDSFVNSKHAAAMQLGPDHYQLYGADLFVGKYFPVSEHFNMLVKAGAGLVHEDVCNKENAFQTVPDVDVKRTELMPAIGMSGQVQFSPNMALSIGMTRFQKFKKIGSIDQYLVGVNWVL